jgi:hypothetical protein
MVPFASALFPPGKGISLLTTCGSSYPTSHGETRHQNVLFLLLEGFGLAHLPQMAQLRISNNAELIWQLSL